MTDGFQAATTRRTTRPILIRPPAGRVHPAPGQLVEFSCCFYSDGCASCDFRIIVCNAAETPLDPDDFTAALKARVICIFVSHVLSSGFPGTIFTTASCRFIGTGRLKDLNVLPMPTRLSAEQRPFRHHCSRGLAGPDHKCCELSRVCGEPLCRFCRSLWDVLSNLVR